MDDISYRGAADLVVNAVSTIVALRQLYPEVYTLGAAWCGLPVLRCAHPEVEDYLIKVHRAVRTYAAVQEHTRVVFVITETRTFRQVEHWYFDLYRQEAGPTTLQQLTEFFTTLEVSGTVMPTRKNHSFSVYIYADTDLPVARGCRASDFWSEALPAEPRARVTGNYTLVLSVPPV